jgi:trehalose 6-phosphate synthase
MSWTSHRLQNVATEALQGAKLVVVANREPFSHIFRDGEICCEQPASGLTTALDPVMRACGGVWVAHGSGEADREVVDERDRVSVPPDDPSYTLRRVWLSKEELNGYYYGFANEALWPLCHIAYTRPKFDSADWEHYRRVNQKFADAVLDEVGADPAVVFVQDYHFALLPRMLKRSRPDLVVAQFWHIPWPNREVFRVCPWQEELLEGLLGNDLLAFHIQYHCNNFLDTVDRSLESRVDWERFSVTRAGVTTRVHPHPISIAPELIAAQLPANLEYEEFRLRKQLGIGGEEIVVGVDRADYTKGIPERLRAIDRMLALFPETKETFVLVQIAAPSRMQIAGYARLNEEIESLVAEINWRHRTDAWQPIVYLNEHHAHEEIYALYRIAAVCVVSSVHDGMNLVAKEFVAAREDSQGVLVLSPFAGAAHELRDALQVNPYDMDGLARAIQSALTMPADEQEERMRRMRQHVEDHNIYRWAGKLLSEIGELVRTPQMAGVGS